MRNSFPKSKLRFIRCFQHTKKNNRNNIERWRQNGCFFLLENVSVNSKKKWLFSWQKNLYKREIYRLTLIECMEFPWETRFLSIHFENLSQRYWFSRFFGSFSDRFRIVFESCWVRFLRILCVVGINDMIKREINTKLWGFSDKRRLFLKKSLKPWRFEPFIWLRIINYTTMD